MSLPRPADEAHAPGALFTRGALLGNVEICREVVDRLLEAGAGRDSIVLEVVSGALRQVGELWEKGEIGVGQEHLASAICERIVHYLFPPVVHAIDGTRRILMVNAPGNRHSIGPRIVGQILESRHYLVDFLPGETPIDEMVAFAELTRPRVIGISLFSDRQIPAVNELITKLRSTLPRVRVMVGGFVRDKRTLAEMCSADASPVAMEEVFSVLEDWLVPAERSLGEDVIPRLLRSGPPPHSS